MSSFSSLASKLQQTFTPHLETSLNVWEVFASKCEIIDVPKNTVLKDAGTAAADFYFILNGSMGLFLWEDGQCVCLEFAFENQFFGDYMSILTNEITPIEVHALENCEVAKIGREVFLELGATPYGMPIMRAAAEATFIDKQRQQISLLTKSSKERLMSLIEKYPNIEQRVAQKHIASYLGITPQSLSRIRSEKF